MTGCPNFAIIEAMRKAWMFLLLAALPLIAYADDAPALDQNSCYYCTQNCTEQGFQKGQYLCQFYWNRTVSFPYDQFQRIRRELSLSVRPTLRDVARALAKRLAKQNVATTAKSNGCWPTLDALSGLQQAPILPRYKILGQLGELLTAYACKNPYATVPIVDKDGNIHGPITLTLAGTPAAVVQKTLTSSGFVCKNQRADISCTQWILNVPLIPAGSLKKLLLVASQISTFDCPSCSAGSATPPAATPAGSIINQVEQVAQSGFLGAHYVCADATESDDAGQGCLTSDAWKSRGNDACTGHCSQDGATCGLTNIQTAGECDTGAVQSSSASGDAAAQ